MKLQINIHGGSLFEHGGQNPIEPFKRLFCFIRSYINNFSEIYADLENLSPLNFKKIMKKLDLPLINLLI